MLFVTKIRRSCFCCKMVKRHKPQMWSVLRSSNFRLSIHDKATLVIPNIAMFQAHRKTDKLRDLIYIKADLLI